MLLLEVVEHLQHRKYRNGEKIISFGKKGVLSGSWFLLSKSQKPFVFVLSFSEFSSQHLSLFFFFTPNNMETLYCSQNQGPSTSRMVDSEPGAALVLTVESTEISACSSGSLISKGKFQGWLALKKLSTVNGICTYQSPVQFLTRFSRMGQKIHVFFKGWWSELIDVHLCMNTGLLGSRMYCEMVATHSVLCRVLPAVCQRLWDVLGRLETQQYGVPDESVYCTCRYLWGVLSHHQQTGVRWVVLMML